MVGIRDTLGHSRHEQLYDYWRAKVPGDGVLPGRQHIDPIDIPLLMPWIVLADVVRADGRMRYRHRLVGTQIAEWVGYDTTGKYFDELHEESYLAWLLPSYDTTVETGAPHFHHPSMGIPLSDELAQFRYSRLLCPFAADGRSVDMLAASFVFFDEAGEELGPGGI